MPQPPEENQDRRWPHLQPHALISAGVGLLAIIVVMAIYWLIFLRAEYSSGLVFVFIGCTVVLSGLFVLLGESVVEDGVKAVIILLIGVFALSVHPAASCFTPGFAAIVASIVNATVQNTLGRYF